MRLMQYRGLLLLADISQNINAQHLVCYLYHETFAYLSSLYSHNALPTVLFVALCSITIVHLFVISQTKYGHLKDKGNAF